MNDARNPDPPADSQPIPAARSAGSEREAVLEQLYDHAALGLGANAALALGVAWGLWEFLPGHILLPWLAATLTLTAACLGLVLAYRSRRPPAGEYDAWKRRFALGVVASGALWGSTGLLFAPALGMQGHVVLAFVLAGLSVAALPAVGPFLSLYVGVVAAVLVPYSLWLLWRDGSLYLAMGAMLGVYAVALALTARKYAERVRESYSLALRISQLVGELTRANRQVDEANRMLLRQIDDRREVEQALRENEKRLRQIIDLVPHRIFARDAQGRYILANKAAALGFATTVEAMVMKHPSELHHVEAEVERMLDDDRGVLSSGTARCSPRVRVTGRDGRAQIFQTTKIPFTDPHTHATAVLGIAVDITEQQRAEQERRRRESLLRAVIDNLPGSIYRRVLHPDGRITYPYVSGEHRMRYGFEPSELMANPEKYIGTVYPEDYALWRQAVERSAADLSRFDLEFRIVTIDGEVRWVRDVGRPHREDDGCVVWDSVDLDITAQKAAEAALRESEERFRLAFDNAPIGMALGQPDDHIQRVNRTLCAMLGYAEEELVGRTVPEITHPDDLDASIENHARLVAGEVDSFQMTKRYRHKDGHDIWSQLSVSAVRDRKGEVLYTIAQIQDVTEAHRLSEQLSYQASHDSLTGLVNRREFELRVNRLLDTGCLAGVEHALCYLDLDQFKLINDTCGHIAGDELLRQLARLLESRVRRRDTLARLGGDEFGVLMEYCSLDQAERVAGLLREAIEEFRFLWEDKSFTIGASMGLVPITAKSRSFAEILHDADNACYMAKDRGRNRLHVYRPDDADVVRRRGEVQRVAQLQRALDADRLTLMYQPIVPLADEARDGEYHEVLLRLVDDDGHLISPNAFLPAAERYNLCERLDRWVVRTAFERLSSHPERLEQLHLCTINLSGQSLVSDAFRGFLIDALAPGLIPAEKICFEITEHAAIANLNSASRFILALKERGCRFALDDFGSGLSSFAYLKTLPVDFLKIDGLFVKDILVDEIDLAMVKSINDIGHVMGKQTIAEFVEQEGIRLKLQEIGVDYAQGYSLGRPRPFEAQ